MTANPQFTIRGTGEACRLPCNQFTVDALLDAADTALRLDDAGAGVVRVEVTGQGVTLHLQQPPPAALGLYCYESRRRVAGAVERIGRAQYRGMTLEWRVAG